MGLWCRCRCRKTSESSEDATECSDDDDDDDCDASSARRCDVTPATSSQLDASLLHRQRGAVVAFDGLPPDLRDPPADRHDPYPSSSVASVRQPFVIADSAHGVDNGLDATTYF